MPSRRRRLVAPAALARVGSSDAPLVVIRDAETEPLLRTNATPLFRAAGLDPNLVRIIVIRDDAIDSFVNTGNRMFTPSRRSRTPRCGSALAGMTTDDAGHVPGGEPARLRDAPHRAMVDTIAQQPQASGAAAYVPAAPGGKDRPAALGDPVNTENRLGDEPEEFS